MKDGWKSTQFQHGLKAICTERDGVSVAANVAPVDGILLLDWLRRRPDLCLTLWDEAEDEKAHPIGAMAIPERECVDNRRNT